MTTVNKLQQALNSAKSLQADLKSFSMDTENQQAKQMFNQLASDLENTVQMLQARTDFVNSEEPQYLQESLGMESQANQQQNKNNQNKMQ